MIEKKKTPISTPIQNIPPTYNSHYHYSCFMYFIICLEIRFFFNFILNIIFFPWKYPKILKIRLEDWRRPATASMSQREEFPRLGWLPC